MTLHDLLKDGRKHAVGRENFDYFLNVLPLVHIIGHHGATLAEQLLTDLRADATLPPVRQRARR